MISTKPDTPGHPTVIAHRGASGYALEHSAGAFRLAADPTHPAHADAVELDVHATADGELVVHHDPVLPSGDAIATMPISSVRATRLPDGSAPITLSQALELVGGLDAWIEAKQLPESVDQHLLAVIAQSRARCHVHSFDHRIVARLHRLDPTLSLGVLSCAWPVDPVAVVTTAGAGTLWQLSGMIDDALISVCHAADIAVIAWTANDIAEIERLVRLGVDGICGDWPDRIRTAIATNETAPRTEGR